MTYAQIIQKKKEKEAKEAAERAAKEAEENHSEQSGKGKRILNPTETLMKVNGYFFQEKLRINPVLCPLLRSQIQPHLLLRLRQRPLSPPLPLLQQEPSQLLLLRTPLWSARTAAREASMGEATRGWPRPTAPEVRRETETDRVITRGGRSQ